MKRSKYVLIAMLISLTLFSCKKDFQPTNTGTVNMSGEWWVGIFLDDTVLIATAEDIGGSIVTSNTAANSSSEVMIDDQGNIWPFRIKAPVDYPNLTFSASTDNINLYDSTVTVNVIDGKILKNAATSPSLHTTDSIVLQLEFSDDPGTIYWFKGYKNTGWPEDRWD